MKKSRTQDYIVSINKVIFFSYLFLCFIGLVVMLDITSMQSSMSNFYRHAIYLGAAFLSVILILNNFNIDKLRFLNIYAIVVSIVLLFLVLVLGPTVKGATRQLNFGLFSIQPSFIARLALVFYFAGILANKQDVLAEKNLWKFIQKLLPLIVFTVLIFVLIIAGKHLSTLIIGGATLLGMLIYAGIRWRFIALIVLLSLIVGTMVLTFGDEYRQSRLQTYKVYNLFSRSRPEPTNAPGEYAVHESLTALTGGGFFGIGMGHGRAKHYYLPEARTDYIYTIIGEEFGFLGAILVLLLHALLFFQAFKIAQAQENIYYKYLCAGLAMNIFLNALVNTGVAMSILPATGNTLPFISYGGTALMVDSISIGVLLNISAKRRQM